MKRVIQVYKGSDQWINSPPGMGDFIRGACHLHELLNGSGVGLRIDVSQTSFLDYIQWDESLLHIGSKENVANAEEFFVDHTALRAKIAEFISSDARELYVSTNLGNWDRLSLPSPTIEYVRKFFRFTNEIENKVARLLNIEEYEVLSIRVGDSYFSGNGNQVDSRILQIATTIIENQILPFSKFPIIITSDSYDVKCELSKRYNMLMLPHRSQHGAFSDSMEPVAVDLCMLKNSKALYHINLWATWWSGFSHYTSLLFQIPGINFRAPNFIPEKVQFDVNPDSRTLMSLIDASKELFTDRWKSYCGYLEVVFRPFRDTSGALLEIGVQQNSILGIWAKYFKNFHAIVGAGIRIGDRDNQFDDNRIKVVEGEIVSVETYHSIKSISSEYDIIVDEVSHSSLDVVNSFVNYFPNIRAGGVYLIVNSNSLYDDRHGGGILNEFSAYAFFKKLSDVVSAEFWKDQISINTYFRTFFPLASTPSFIVDGLIDSIEFRKSVIIIRKVK